MALDVAAILVEQGAVAVLVELGVVVSLALNPLEYALSKILMLSEIKNIGR